VARRRPGRPDDDGGAFQPHHTTGSLAVSDALPELLMLTAAALGMVGYGLYSAGLGLAGLLGFVPLEVWANLGLIVLGLLLMLSAAFVRVRMPGGLALALSALLGLQALALHNDLHFFGATMPVMQVARGAFAALLAALAYRGARHPGEPGRTPGEDAGPDEAASDFR
jgi:hypothetical protein